MMRVMVFSLILILALSAVAALIGLIGLTLVVARLSHRLPRGPFPHGEIRMAPETGRIARALAARLAKAADKNAVQLLTDPVDALAARLELVAAAEASLDLQYYIWQDDIAGALMLGALRAAAARGVRVRLLIDDNGTAGLDRTLAALDQLPNIEVRLFNPFPIRRARVLGYLSDFRRLNRRMHNKAMIADGRIAILGGRNIGDDYFNDLSSAGLYMDMDVAVAGPVLPQVGRQFDLYWNAPSAIPARVMLGGCAEEEARAIVENEELRLCSPDASAYAAAIASPERGKRILDPDAPNIAAEAQLIYDHPSKIHGLLKGRKLLWEYLIRALGTPTQELVLITPYLVPTRAGVGYLRRIAKAGAKIRVLTNSYAATDVPLVHSGYAHRRKSLLRAGIELYEYAPDAEARLPTRLRPGQFVGSDIRGTSPFSRNKLHAKVFAADRERVFIGSFNFDPRSMRLNTELGLVLVSPEIAAHISDAFREFFPERAWRLRLTRTQQLRWSRPGQPVLKREPGVPLTHRIVLWIAQRLPIEWML
ncbi:phospholipase D family protein [Thioclava marina]|uniref:phospholipase D family protein n=1 Tax=Thioclava marina TaxID=1915077 RepID=UPI000996A785|nr:phospholipase D family protein [Thioclava marina]